MLSFNKQKKSTPPQKELEETALLVLQTPLSPEQAAAQAELSDAIKPIRAKKDTFISNGTQFTGVLEVDGNIVVEGQVEGNIICAHIVRIENSGQVKGEIRAQQIMINGAVFGRCYSESLSIQPKGSVHGDIFADEISIEKGGIFIGQSQLMQKNLQEQQIPAKITPLKITTSATEHEVKLNKQNK